MYTPSQDNRLFEFVRQGNRLAYQNLFTAYYEPLCRFAMGFLSTTEDAEEIVSDVFFILWKNRADLVIEKSIKAYLYTCVKHAALALIKKRNITVHSFDNNTFEIPDTSHPAQQLEDSEMQAHFQQAVDKLPARCRQIFILNRFESLRYKEISELLDISEKTVENQIVKALGILRQTLLRYMREIS